MDMIRNYLKGIIAGIGGVAPGLSGSVLLVLLGLYEKTIQAISAPFKNFKANVRFLVPLVLGLGCGVLIFSKLVDFLLTNYELYTRYAFLGLVLGTIPLFYQQVQKNGFSKRYYLVIVGSALLGYFLFGLGGSAFPEITQPNLLQSVLLGFSVAASSIVPGIDSAVILSALGLYELYVSSVANLNFAILLPAGVGLILGVFIISAVMNLLLKKIYTLTFSVIFGLFISILPKVLNEQCALQNVWQGVGAILCAVVGCGLSFYFSDVRTNNARIKRLFQK